MARRLKAGEVQRCPARALPPDGHQVGSACARRGLFQQRGKRLLIIPRDALQFGSARGQLPILSEGGFKAESVGSAHFAIQPGNNGLIAIGRSKKDDFTGVSPWLQRR
jgi:hypothetical protein